MAAAVNRGDLVFFTIAAANYIPQVRVLFSSLTANRPGCRFYCFLSDEFSAAFSGHGEAFPVIAVSSIDVPDFKGMTTRYGITELSTAVKPTCFKHLHTHFDAEKIVYLDPDIMVFGELEDIDRLLSDGAEAIVTPHLCEPVDDQNKPGELEIIRSGIYNLGFLALKITPATSKFLDWWEARLRRLCIFDLENGLHVDQKWCDFLPAFVGNVAILRDAGYNVAYWNLMHRKLRLQNCRWLANDRPLQFFHFSGLESDKPESVSRHQDRFMMKDLGPAAALFHEYRDKLIHFGWETARAIPWAYRQSSKNLFRSDLMQRLTRTVAIKRSLHSDDHIREAVYDYCNELEPSDFRLWPITKLVRHIWTIRHDVAKSYPDSTEGRRGVSLWMITSGLREHELPTRAIRGFVEASLKYARDIAHRPRKGPYRIAVSSAILLRLTLPALRAFAVAPSTRLRRHGESLARRLMRHVLLHLSVTNNYVAPDSMNRHQASPPELDGESDTAVSSQLSPARTRMSKILRREEGVLVFGYPRAETGVGEITRLIVRSLGATNLKHACADLHHHNPGSQNDHRLDAVIANHFGLRVNIYSINADMMPDINETFAPSFFESRFNISWPSWELERFPKIWASNLKCMDEVWTHSEFMRSSFARAMPDKPVLLMPIVISPPEPETLSREAFGIPATPFIFLFSFDPASYVARKNPEAVIRAFSRAFPSQDQSEAMLIIRVNDTSGGRMRGSALDELPPAVHLIERPLSKADFSALLLIADCYVSLHRSEGFGLGIAEAQYFGKPVIATDYGGNRDFLTPETGIPISYRLVPLGNGDYQHWEGQFWAEPDLDEAANSMRRIFENSALRHGLGAKAALHIRQRYCAERAGERYVKRLRELGLVTNTQH